MAVAARLIAKIAQIDLQCLQLFKTEQIRAYTVYGIFKVSKIAFHNLPPYTDETGKTDLIIVAHRKDAKNAKGVIVLDF
jgi:hypothetical protein